LRINLQDRKIACQMDPGWKNSLAGVIGLGKYPASVESLAMLNQPLVKTQKSYERLMGSTFRVTDIVVHSESTSNGPERDYQRPVSTRDMAKRKRTESSAW
jgi:hypothetical protein